MNRWFENNVEVRKEVIDLLTEETEALHRKASKSLLQFSECSHVQSIVVGEVLFPCTPCLMEIDNGSKNLQYQNTVVANLMSDIVQLGSRAPMLSRVAAYIVHELIEAKLTAFDDHKKDAAKNFTRQLESTG